MLRAPACRSPARVTGRSAPLAEVEAAHAPASAGRWLAPAPRIRSDAPFLEAQAPARRPGAERRASLMRRLFGGGATARPSPSPEGAEEQGRAGRGRRGAGGGAGRLAEAASLYEAAGDLGRPPRRPPGGPAERTTPPPSSGASRGRGGEGGGGRAAPAARCWRTRPTTGRPGARRGAGGDPGPGAGGGVVGTEEALEARRQEAVEAACAIAEELEPRLEETTRWFRGGAATSTGDAAAAARHFSRLREVAREPSTRAVAASGRLLALSRALVWDSWDEARAPPPRPPLLLGLTDGRRAMSLPLPAAAKRAALVRSARFLLRQVAAAGHAAPSGPETSMGWSWRQVFGLQDRNRVEIYVYNRWEGLGLGDSPVLREVAAAAAKQYDVRGWSARRIAEQINTDGAHVLVHLDFWTALHSTIGSTGAPFFDYLFGDRVSTAPEAALGELSEKALVLPPPLSIAMNSLRSILSSEALQQTSREEEGLPPGARVLAVHHRSAPVPLHPRAPRERTHPHQTVKLYPELMDVWGNALRRSPSSVLWMLEELQLDVAPAAGAHSPPAAPAPAEARAPALIGAAAGAARRPRRPLPRHALYNGVTTLLDYLFGGVPAVTLRGDSISSRVASAMCTRLGGASCEVDGRRRQRGWPARAGPVARSLKAYEDWPPWGPGPAAGPRAGARSSRRRRGGRPGRRPRHGRRPRAAGEAPAHLILAAAAPSD
eukprot:tig00000734_g3757.t1